MIRTTLQAFRRSACVPLTVAGLVALTGCGDSTGPDPGPDYDAIDPVVYSAHVQPIFDASCATASCHTAPAPASGLDLSSYAALREGSHHGSMVIPFRPDLSHLYLHLTGDVPPRMPLNRDPLSDPAQRLFRRWIEAGAAFDGGDAMYAETTRKAFVACQGENAVATLDMDAERVVRVFDVDAPHSVFVDPDRKRVYVSRFVTANDNIHVYDAETYGLLFTGRAGSKPALMGLNPAGTQLWVTNFTEPGGSDHAVRILDANTLDEIVPGGVTAPLVEQPHGLAIAPSGTFVYVTNILSDDISIFTQDPIGVDTVVPLPQAGALQQPQQCVLSPAEDYLYVSAHLTDRVYVMRTSDNVFVATVDVGARPWHLTLSPDGNQLWVANWVGNSVSVLDVSNPESPGMVVRDLAPMHGMHARPAIVRPIGIAFAPDGSRVYVTNANDDQSGSGHHPPPAGELEPGSVTIFDPWTRQVRAVAEVPAFARFVSFLP